MTLFENTVESERITRQERIDPDFSAEIAIPNVNATKLSSIKIPIPPEEEQKRIVAKLDEIFAVIENAKQNTEETL